jgi:hypothetical protein
VASRPVDRAACRPADHVMACRSGEGGAANGGGDGGFGDGGAVKVLAEVGSTYQRWIAGNDHRAQQHGSSTTES